MVVGYAVGPAILSRRLAGLPSIGVMALSLALCAAVYLPIAAAQWPSVVPSTNVLVAVVILGTVCTAAAFLVFAALIAEIGPVRATVITYVNPAVAAVLGVLLLDETFSVAMGIGFALVILGSTLATRSVTGRSTSPGGRPSGVGDLVPQVDHPGTRRSAGAESTSRRSWARRRLDGCGYPHPEDAGWPAGRDAARLLA